jgi:UDP-N-acetylglucosamine 4,6-dehydratase
MKTILITGGTGSFGSALVKDILNKESYDKVIIFSRDWLKQKTLRDELGNPSKCRWFIGDIRDKDRLNRAVKNVDVLVHAAAIKDLDSCEYNPSEAMLTNVQGTQNVIDVCIENKVRKCMFISTDKAVDPINTYGTTKALGERLWLNGNKYAASDATCFSVCRYGNVVGSSGSVVPYFKSLIEKGATSLPITHPDMTRFWFEMPSVLEFVNDSIEFMQGGEIYIPELPSVRIVDVCRAMNRDYYITAVREGEKIHETMGQEYDSGTNPWFLSVTEIKSSIYNCVGEIQQK